MKYYFAHFFKFKFFHSRTTWDESADHQLGTTAINEYKYLKIFQSIAKYNDMHKIVKFPIPRIIFLSKVHNYNGITKNTR